MSQSAAQRFLFILTFDPSCVSHKCGCGEAVWELYVEKNEREAQRKFVEGSIVWAFHPIVQVQPWLKVR